MLEFMDYLDIRSYEEFEMQPSHGKSGHIMNKQSIRKKSTASQE